MGNICSESKTPRGCEPMRAEEALPPTVKPVQKALPPESKVVSKNIPGKRDLRVGAAPIKVKKFSFGGLSGKGIVSSVIDGDTIDLTITIPLSSLCEVAEFEGCDTLTSMMKTTIRCRLSGVDFAEKNTKEGVYAIKLMIDLYQSSCNAVHYKICDEQDKYGRSLVYLYSDSGHTSSINLKYLDVKHPETGNPIMERYDGGTKSTLMKSLQTYKGDELKKIKLETL
jgi:endonuclease YncB( thermonuclease family)